MERRKLGNTDLEVSEIAFGGVEIGIPYGIGVKGEEDMLPEKDAIDLLLSALDKGINFFDTARMYGVSEERMGKAFRGRRDEVVISSKCHHFRGKDGLLPDDAGIREIVRTSIRKSLDALQTDYIDLYMLHQADLEILNRPVITEEILKLKEAGIVRAVGVSTYTVEETRTAIGTGVWNVIQLPFNLMDQRQSSLFERAAASGMGIVIRSVLLKGLLSTRGKNLHPALTKIEQHIASYGQLLGEDTHSLPDLAIRFALSFPEVSSVLIGIDKPAYLEAALESANGSYLSSDRLQQARQMAYPDPEFINLPHWDRMGWLT